VTFRVVWGGIEPPTQGFSVIRRWFGMAGDDLCWLYVSAFAEEQDQESSPWKDAGLVAEMDRRIAELESGKVQGYTWNEVKQRARNSIKPK